MDQEFSLRRASRRFEMMVSDGLPETTVPMYQEDTHGKASGHSVQGRQVEQDGKVAAVYVVRNGEVVVEHPGRQKG